MSDDLRALDVRVAREVFGLDVRDTYHESDGPRESGWEYMRVFGAGSLCYPVPRYTADDGLALQALDRLCERFSSGEDPIIYEMKGGKGCTVIFEITVPRNDDTMDNDYFTKCEHTRPLAIVRAVLAFLDWKKENGNDADRS